MYLEEFFDYLKKTKKKAQNTVEAYGRDVMEFKNFLSVRGKKDYIAAGNVDVVSFLLELKKSGRSNATLNRKLASIRAFYGFLVGRRVITKNPTVGIKSPKIDRKEIKYLTIEEIEMLLNAPDDSIKGMRDKAILELLYATGIRVTELVEADVEDINLMMGFITCMGEQSTPRIVPIGRPARTVLADYLENFRDKLVKGNKKETALFTNYYGKRITRQGLWKILREYGHKTGLEDRLTPNTIRNSFAVHMIQNGADLKSLQEMLGHEDISATQVYLSVTERSIKDVYDKTHPRAF